MSDPVRFVDRVRPDFPIPSWMAGLGQETISQAFAIVTARIARMEWDAAYERHWELEGPR